MKPIHSLPAGLAVTVLAACSSSSAPEAVEGLSTPSQLSIVTASPSGGTDGAITAGAGATSFPEDADYHADIADVWVYDPSIKPIELVNEILCMMSQTKAGAMVNQGAYLAQINAERCEQGSSGNDDDGQSSGGGSAFEIWTVLSQRGSNTGVQDVNVWVPGDSDSPNGEETIFVDVDVTQGVSAENPFGVFSMDFAGAPDFAGLADPFFFGTMQTLDAAGGNLGFSFYEEYGFDDGSEMVDETIQVVVNMTADQESGFGRVFRHFEGDFGFGTFTEEEDFTVAFNETHLLRAEGTDPPVCLSREEFDTKVWRYNLYHADGEKIGDRVNLNSGFGFRTLDGDYGWIGYYGLWTPEDVTLEDGATIVEDVWGDEDPAQYTVFRAPGRLIRFTRDIVPLQDIVGQTFELWLWDEMQGTGANYQVAFDGSVWTKTAVMDEETFEWTPIEPPEALTFQNGEWVGLWSQSLGGHVDYIEGDACGCVTVYSEDFVTPEDALFDTGTSITLQGYFEMLGAGITEVEAESGDVFLPEVQDVGSPYTFTLDSSDMTLRDESGDPVGLVDGAMPQSGPNTWGMRSGPMVLDTSGLTQVWDVFAEDVYYVYETGHNDWNQYTAAVDQNGDFVSFDPPLQFAYTHATANDRNGDDAYDGGTYFLNYEGPGNLWGIPHEGTDTDGDGEEDRWYPVFSLADGVMVGPTGTEYVVKATEMEQTLAPAPGECGALDLGEAASLTLPDGSSFETPDIGPQPAVDDPPAVVDGTVQTAETL